MSAHGHARQDAGTESGKERFGGIGGGKSGKGAGQHHALEADVEDARLLGDLLAQPGEKQRHSGRDSAEEEGGDEGFAEQAVHGCQSPAARRRRWSRNSVTARNSITRPTSTSTK